MKGLLKVIQRNPTPGAVNAPTLSIVLVADEIKGKTDLSASHLVHHWISGPEIREEGIDVDHFCQGIISQLEANATIYPLELVESMDVYGIRRVKGNLEKQMLEEASYGEYGNKRYVCVCDFVFVFISSYFVELKQIKEEFVNICGSPSAVINVEEFTRLITKLGMPEDRCKDCFR